MVCSGYLLPRLAATLEVLESDSHSDLDAHVSFHSCLQKFINISKQKDAFKAGLEDGNQGPILSTKTFSKF